MPSLADHQSAEYTKLLLMGDSGTGKTGALASLVETGYEIGILDMDVGLDALVNILRRKDPALLGKVSFESFRDKLKANANGISTDGAAKAFTKAMGAMTKWPTDESIPSEWGANKIFVLDSLTFLGKAAYSWCDSMDPGAKDKRQIFFAAQNALESVLSLLTSTDFKTNVIVISHVNYVDRQDGTTKGFPSGIGGALSPKIPAYFNSVVLAETKGTGDAVKRTIRTLPTSLIDLKNPASQDMPIQLPLETGLATFFQKVQGKE